MFLDLLNLNYTSSHPYHTIDRLIDHYHTIDRSIDYYHTIDRSIDHYHMIDRLIDHSQAVRVRMTLLGI